MRGRPRKLRNESELEFNTIIEQGVKVADKLEIKNIEKYLPYEGKDKLPLPVRDKRGKVTKKGEPRYFLNGNSSSGFKLIAAKNSGKGVERNLVRVLKIRSNTKRGDKDRKILAELRASGIPGY